MVVDHRGFVPVTAAALSSKRVYPLHSSFRPTFNMAVNLLNSSDYETARITLDHSFAQWEANESAWQLEAQMDTLKKALEGYEHAFTCEFGDFADFMRLRMRLSELEKNERRRLKHEVFRTQSERSQAFMDLDEKIAAMRELIAIIHAVNALICSSISNGGIVGRVKCANWNGCGIVMNRAPDRWHGSSTIFAPYWRNSVIWNVIRTNHGMRITY